VRHGDNLPLVDLEVGAAAGRSLADRAAVGVLTRTFPIELVDRVIDQFWRREQRVRQLPARLVFYLVLCLCLFPQESYRSTMKILMNAFGRAGDGRAVPTAGAIGTARRRLGSDPVGNDRPSSDQAGSGPGTPGAWYRDWRLVAFDGTTFTVPDTEENDEQFGRPTSGRGDGRAAYPQVQAACLVELGTHAVFDARLEPYEVSENRLIDEMLSALRPGMLVLADRGVYSFWRWFRAADAGADLLWRVKSNLILRPVERLADGSYIAEVIPPKHASQIRTGSGPQAMATLRNLAIGHLENGRAHQHRRRLQAPRPGRHPDPRNPRTAPSMNKTDTTRLRRGPGGEVAGRGLRSLR
jgi:hypothetical protein